MKTHEVIKQLKEQKTEQHCFIKWWRKENDFVDVELVDSFQESIKGVEEIAGFELLDMEQMWSLLKRVEPAHLAREKQGDVEVVRWHRPDKEGAAREQVCPFEPETLMTVFNVATKGNYIE